MTKKDQILSVSRELFWKHGFKRVSIEEICEKAGISKMTFYRAFPDKISVAKAVFEAEVERGMKRFREILHDNSSPAEKIKSILKMKSDSTTNISREFLQDFYSSEKTELRNYVADLTTRTWTESINDFKKAQKRGVFRKDFKPEFLFYISQKLAESLTDEKLLALYGSPHELLVELSNFFGYGLSPHDDKK